MVNKWFNERLNKMLSKESQTCTKKNALRLSLAVVLAAALVSCQSEEKKKEDEQADIQKLYDEMVALSESGSCTDGGEWRVTDYGDKACGGPEGYIAYSSKIDTVEFLEKVEEHRAAQIAFCEKFGCVSTCDLPLPPSEIGCYEGKPVFIYSFEWYSHVDLTKNEAYTVDTYINGDEESVSIVEQAEHYLVSETSRDDSTFNILYHYQPKLDYVGPDTVVIKKATGSDGAGPNTQIEIMKIIFNIQ